MQLNINDIELLNDIKEIPAISLILPLKVKTTLNAEAKKGVKLALNRTRKQLEESYPKEYYTAALTKLDEAAQNIDYDQLKNSVAIFASPSLSKVYYLDIPVEEKIVIDNSFEIRDLVYAKQQNLKYIVFMITARQAKIFLSDNGNMATLSLQVPDNIVAYENDLAERVTNFSDPSDRKEVLLDKFLNSIDKALTVILKTYNLPVFLLGVDKVLGHYKRITANDNSIVATIHGNYQELTIPEIQALLQPYVEGWKKKITASILNEIEIAAGSQKLISGIHAVWKAAKDKNARLLIVEKNYVYPSKANAIHVKDAVDDIIEEVIKSGGEVQFVEEGQLVNYGRIVLIRYY